MAPLALAPAASSSALDLTGMNLALVVTVAVIALVALVFGVIFRRQVLAADPGTDKMQEIGAAVEEGAKAYLARQFKTLGLFVVLVFGLLLLLPADTAGVKWGRSGLLRRRRRLLGADRLHGHAPGHQGQRPGRLGRPWRERPRRRHQDRLPHRRCRRHDHGRPGPARRLRRRAPLQGRRPQGARGLRLRCGPARDVHASRRRHLHQGRRRRRRPRRQGRGRHPRGRPAQRRHHRRQRR